MNMDQNRLNREWLLRYVAGELPEDEIRAADEQFFANDEFAGAVDEQYRDLLDAYAAGEISGFDKERVEKIFLGDAEQRRQLKILTAMQARPGKLPDATPGSMGFRFFSFWPVAISAGLLSFAIAVLVYQHSPRLQAIADRNAPISSAVNEAPSSSGAAAPAPQMPAGSAFTILLLPNVSRGAADAKKFTIPEKAARVVFQVVLPVGQEGSEFDVQLKVKDQTEARAFSGLTAKKIETQKYVEFSMPSNGLPTEQYDLKISRAGASGPAIEQFELSVERGSAAR
jgi:hypothetical protein